MTQRMARYLASARARHLSPAELELLSLAEQRWTRRAASNDVAAPGRSDRASKAQKVGG